MTEIRGHTSSEERPAVVPARDAALAVESQTLIRDGTIFVGSHTEIDSDEFRRIHNV